MSIRDTAFDGTLSTPLGSIFKSDLKLIQSPIINPTSWLGRKILSNWICFDVSPLPCKLYSHDRL
ncbi:MAG: hypothetical protein MUF58_21620 [Arcicella sp.]|nr:hypothetical protein [Arcicella sp.]